MKDLYYIRGNKENPESVKQALLNRGGNLILNHNFDEEHYLYYINSDNIISYASIYSQAGEILLSHGTELKLIEPEETFEPGDKVFVSYNGYWEFSIFSHTTPEGHIHCCGVLYDECHHYEPWMKKYLGKIL